MRQRLAILLALLAAGGVGVGIRAIATDAHTTARPVSFGDDVQPIFDRSCTSCHPLSYPYLDLRRGRSYGQLVRVPASTDMTYERVLPGRPELSYLLTHPLDPSNAMLLTKRDRDLIARWITAGAPNN